MPTILEQNNCSIIIALSETELGKVTLPIPEIVWKNLAGEIVDIGYQGAEPTFEREVEALQKANTINALFPKFIRTDTWQTDDGKTHKMLVMERLYALPTHHFDLETRKMMMHDFETKMKELHDKYFVHGDFCRPTNYYTRNNYEWMFKNILQTEQGLRLIDTGFSKYLSRDKNIETLVRCRMEEQEDMKLFRAYYFEEWV